MILRRGYDVLVSEKVNTLLPLLAVVVVKAKFCDQVVQSRVLILTGKAPIELC